MAHRIVLIYVNRQCGEDVYRIYRVTRTLRDCRIWLEAVRGHWHQDGGHYERRMAYYIPKGFRVKKNSTKCAFLIVRTGDDCTAEALGDLGEMRLNCKILTGCIRMALQRLYQGDAREAIRNLREGLLEVGEKET